MGFEFATASRVVFGAGTISQAASIARSFGVQALLVTGRDAARSHRLIDSLVKEGVQVVPFAVDGEPDLETVRRGLEVARRERCGLVIAMGGGSALDAGKSIAIMLNHEGEVLDYLEVIGGGKTFVRPSAPFIAIPTTAGTGSEVTRNAVLSSPEHRVKASLRSPFMLPRVALIDPELTFDLPPAITARTGLDALTQLIEPYICLRASPMTDAICVRGFQAVRSLRAAYENGKNAEARENMALASLFGGLALSNSGLGAVHGLAGAIGGMFSAPHGAICGALLPHVMRANASALKNKDVAPFLTGREDATVEEGIEWVQQLVADLKTRGLEAYGVTPDSFAEIIDKASHASSMKANPVVLTRVELTEILRKAL